VSLARLIDGPYDGDTARLVYAPPPPRELLVWGDGLNDGGCQEGAAPAGSARYLRIGRDGEGTWLYRWEQTCFPRVPDIDWAGCAS
jgi:hypothetical protein